jgi:hypothetical protein
MTSSVSRVGQQAASQLGEAPIIAEFIIDLRREAKPQAAVEQHAPGADAMHVDDAVDRCARQLGFSA